jgi:hypothetical protein
MNGTKKNRETLLVACRDGAGAGAGLVSNSEKPDLCLCVFEVRGKIAA